MARIESLGSTAVLSALLALASCQAVDGIVDTSSRQEKRLLDSVEENLSSLDSDLTVVTSRVKGELKDACKDDSVLADENWNAACLGTNANFTLRNVEWDSVEGLLPSNGYIGRTGCWTFATLTPVDSGFLVRMNVDCSK